MTPEQEREMQELDVEIQIAETELAIIELQQSLKGQLNAETSRKAVA